MALYSIYILDYYDDEINTSDFRIILVKLLLTTYTYLICVWNKSDVQMCAECPDSLLGVGI